MDQQLFGRGISQSVIKIRTWTVDITVMQMLPEVQKTLQYVRKSRTLGFAISVISAYLNVKKSKTSNINICVTLPWKRVNEAGLYPEHFYYLNTIILNFQLSVGYTDDDDLYMRR